jgi:hypothetical protein
MSKGSCSNNLAFLLAAARAEAKFPRYKDQA